MSVSLQRALFVVAVLAALLLEGAYFANMVMWREAPDRGWLAYAGTGLDVVAATRPPGEAAGMQVGDRILSINGGTYTTFREMKTLLDLELGQPNIYRIQRGNETLDLTVMTRPFGLATVLRQSGPYWLVGMIFVFMGVLVYAMKPYHGPSWAFLALAAVFGIALPFTMVTASFSPTSLDAVPTIATLLVGAALIHLAFLFPQRRALVADRLWLIAVPYAVAIAVAIPATRVLAADVPGWVIIARYLLVLVGLVVLLGSSLTTYLRSNSVAARLQALVILTGSLIAFALPFSDQLFARAFGFHLVEDYVLFTAVSLIAFPLAIGYAIARHDLFEIDVIVRRTYGYLLSTAVVIVLYGTTVSLLNVTIGPSEITASPIFTVAFVLAVVFLMQPLQGRIQGFVDRAFYRQQYDYRKTITDVTDRMTSLLEPDLVRHTLVSSAVDEMFLENGLLLAPPEEGRDQLEVLLQVGEGWSGRRLYEVRLDKTVWQALSEPKIPVFRHEIELAPQYEANRADMLVCFDELEAELMLPMLFQGELRAVLSLGRKKSGRMFTREDVDLLHTLVGQGAIALENARLFDEVADSLKQIQMLESIKSNLAKFVPQTVQTMLEDSSDADEIFQKRDRDLSVMFADMTGYTRLSAQLPQEELNSIIETYFGAFLDEILQFGGDVNETAGDGLMVLFQDDDPDKHAKSAVRAALAIQRITRELNSERSDVVPIGMHIGINSGTAAVGATKIQGGVGMRWTYTASGSVTNISARIGAIGEEIAITDETRRRLGDGFQVEEVGPQSLKNVSEPVMVYRVTA